MTVKEFIKYLKTFDPDAHIKIGNRVDSKVSDIWTVNPSYSDGKDAFDAEEVAELYGEHKKVDIDKLPENCGMHDLHKILVLYPYKKRGGDYH